MTPISPQFDDDCFYQSIKVIIIEILTMIISFSSKKSVLGGDRHCAHPAASVFANLYVDVKKHLCNVHNCTCTVKVDSTARSRKHSKSMLAHDAVVDELSHEHHPIIHLHAGPIQMVYGSHSRLKLAADLILDRKIYFQYVFGGLREQEGLIAWS